MGWNDRLPEDPYIPYESQEDSDAYENWAMYTEMLQAEEAAGGLTSNNIQPGAVDMSVKEMQESIKMLDRLRALMKQFAPRKTDCGAPMPHETDEDQNSRQSAHHSAEQ